MNNSMWKKIISGALASLLVIGLAGIWNQMRSYASEERCKARAEESAKRDDEIKRMIHQISKATLENTKSASRLEGILDQLDKRLGNK